MVPILQGPTARSEKKFGGLAIERRFVEAFLPPPTADLIFCTCPALTGSFQWTGYPDPGVLAVNCQEG
jgi:hypothetical protein